jgi:hypothetical protein
VRARVHAMMIKRQIEGAHNVLLGENSVRFAGLKFAASFVLWFAVCVGFNLDVTAGV